MTIKNPNTNTKPRKCPKNSVGKPRGESSAWRTFPQILALGQEFKEDCRKSSMDPQSERLTVERFWIERNIHPDTAMGWARKYPEFKHEYDLGKLFLGCKKMEGIYMRRYEPNKTSFRLHQYVPAWGEAEKYHADLKNVKDAMAQLLGVKFDVPDLENDENQ